MEHSSVKIYCHKRGHASSINSSIQQKEITIVRHIFQDIQQKTPKKCHIAFIAISEYLFLVQNKTEISIETKRH